jgi:hypothetical protein
MADPRTSVGQCLNALLTAELTDNDGWEMLIKLARGLGHEEVASKFEDALENEQEHLQNVRTWITAMVGQEAGMKAVPVPGTRPAATSAGKSEKKRSTKAKR